MRVDMPRRGEDGKGEEEKGSDDDGWLWRPN